MFARQWRLIFITFSYLTQSGLQVALQKSIPTRIHQLILYVHNIKGYVDGFVGGVDFCQTTFKILCVK